MKLLKFAGLFLIIAAIISGVIGAYVDRASNISPGPASVADAGGSTTEQSYDCQDVQQEGVTFFLVLQPTKPDYACIELLSQADILQVINKTGRTVTVTLGSQSVSIPVNGSVNFTASIWDYRYYIENTMQVSGYNATEYPHIWRSDGHLA